LSPWSLFSEEVVIDTLLDVGFNEAEITTDEHALLCTGTVLVVEGECDYLFLICNTCKRTWQIGCVRKWKSNRELFRIANINIGGRI
jgi:hypothetical protein